MSDVLVSALMTGEYIIPNILGSGKYVFVGNLIGDQFSEAQNQPFGSALAIALMAALSAVWYVRGPGPSTRSPRGRW